MNNLIQRLGKCCCNNIRYNDEPGKWYKIEMLYGKRYYRFFALTFEELEQQSLSAMRKVNREIKGMKSLEVRLYRLKRNKISPPLNG